VADLSASFGVVLDPWQEDVLRAAMGERSDGRWSTPQVGLSTPRQNGKSQLIVARALAGVLLFGERTIICSAHQQDTAREVFTRLVDICEAYPSLNARVDQYGKALNREYIRFKSGQVIRFKARSAGGGRGFSCDCLLLDEAQILGASAWSAILPTMSARPNPQAWLLGTPPTPDDDGEVFTRLRRAAQGGKASHLAWLEWGADPEDDLDDPATWASANPAFPSRISHDAIAGERASMADDQFRLERLGIWPDDIGASRAVPADTWTTTGRPAAPTSGIKSFGVAFSQDGMRVGVGGAMKHDDGVHVELVGAHTGSVGSGLSSLAEWLAARWRDTATIVISGGAGAGVLKSALRDRGVPEKVIHVATTPEYTTSSAMLLEGLLAGTVTHLATDGQAALDESVAVCDKKARGTSGAWGWTATTPGGDETPTEAVSLALWGAKTTKRRPGRTTRGAVLA
jgi:hypothetical protein